MKILNVTLNPNDMGTGITLSNGNLSFSAATPRQAVRATHGKTTGKWYWEVKLDSGATANVIGISNKSFPHSYPDTSPYWRSLYAINGVIFPGNTSYGSGWAVGDIIGVALDLDNGTLGFYKNGLTMGISHTDIKDLGEVYPTIATMSTSVKTITFNFGGKPFAYNIPSDFNAYNIEMTNKFLISTEGESHSILDGRKNTDTSIPIMTSDTAPSGRAFAGTVYSTNFPPWKAFNGIDDAEGYASLSGSGGVGYLGYEFPNAISLYKYVVRSNDSGHLNKMPKDWTFEGSNDSVNWTVLDRQVDQTWTVRFTDKEYILDDSWHNMKFKMYRLNWTANNGFATYTDVNELKMFEIIVPKLAKVPSLSESYFNKYGMSKGVDIDLHSSIVSISEISDTSELLGPGKVFKQPIDRSKRKAHKIILG